MKNRGAARAVLAALGAMAGTGFASGRQIALFFTQMGKCRVWSMAAASALFAALMGGVCLLARRSGVGLGAVRRHLGRGTGRALGALNGVLMGAVCLMMLACAYRLGELTLPARLGGLYGAAMALALAALILLCRLKPLPALGAACVSMAVLFYAALAVDPRPTRVYLSGTLNLALEDNPAAALALAVLYAAMNGCVAAEACSRFAAERTRPFLAAAFCGCGLFAVLIAADAALTRGGRMLIAQRMPTVILAARWGVAGFWLCAGFEYLCAVSTLSAALAGLLGGRLPGSRDARQ